MKKKFHSDTLLVEQILNLMEIFECDVVFKNRNLNEILLLQTVQNLYRIIVWNRKI